MFSSFT